MTLRLKILSLLSCHSKVFFPFLASFISKYNVSSTNTPSKVNFYVNPVMLRIFCLDGVFVFPITALAGLTATAPIKSNGAGAE
ncbi:MAG: hypothetical protein P9L92_20670 [Candidatus Electryonea clarkiae]|nr:hypothetical protein [Candidatus Electryonea clarkiae]MDP8285893.1 hypothetical protein [Candidatus Electryonea clarkiae]